MPRTKNYLIVVLLASVVIAISACTMFTHHNRMQSPAGGQGYAGPPDSPSHGYRYKQSDGIELVFDSGIGVYAVSGHSDNYYHQGKYYRWNNNSWEASSKISEGWAPTSDDAVPPGLRKTHSHQQGR